jgi:RHS repeat-associated protein
MVGSTVLRSFVYDTNTLDSTFSGSYTAGRLVAVQHAAFTPNGFEPGSGGGSNVTIPSTMQFVEIYGYTQAALTSGKRLQVQETLRTYLNGVAQNTPQTLNLDAAYTYDIEGKMTSVNYPETWAWSSQTNNLVSTNGPTYTYSFDAMDRPTGLKDQNNNTIVNNVTYNAANQLLTFNTETRTYNNLNQMTQLTITGAQPLNISYNFPAGTNNGKISSQLDNISGETVTYQYDSLNRLLSASSTQSWSETYGFDGFGNLLSKTGTGGAPTLSQAVNTANNQIVGQTYDANGNQESGPLVGVSYDAENRVTGAGASTQYAYDSRNKRIWNGTLTNGNLSQQVYFYGVDGQKLGTYTFNLGTCGEGNAPEMTNSATLLAIFFGSKRVGTFDRLGSAKYNQQNALAQSFYPYGEDRGTVEPNDSLKFATYTRDSATGLDYADQRYYANNFGRMMSPDPYAASGGPKSPVSWNRYTYAIGDPVNGTDPSGRYACDPDDPDCPVDECTPGDGDCSPGPEPQPGPGGGPGITAGIPPGLLGPWSYGGDNTFGLALPFADGGAVAVGVCVAQPELCLAVGVGAVVTIYVLAPGIRALIEAIQSQITSREAAPVYFPPYNPGRDSNGNCKPPDPKKFVKWQGTGGDHWYWITWNQNPADCWTYPDYKSGPNDPGPAWTEIPR